MTEKRLPALLRALIILLGLTLLLVAYYWVHKPFNAESALRYAGMAIDVAAAALLMALAGGLGRAVTGWIARRATIDLTTLSRAERLALAAGVGLGLFSVIGLALGLTGLYTRAAFVVALLGVLIVTFRHTRAWLADLLALLRAIRADRPFTAFLIVFVLIMLGLALIHALTPVYAWDALVYHLVEPQRDLAAGRMTASPDNFYLGFPKAAETLYGLLIGLTGRDTSAAPLHLGVGVLALMAAAGLARRKAGIQAGWLTAALLLGSFNVWELYGWPYVDLFVMLAGALAFSLLLGWDKTRSAGWLILLGIVCAFAFSVKYTAGPLILACLLVLLIRQPRAILRNGLIFGLTALVAASPWLLRGLLLYGNPIYPYLLGGLSWNAERTLAFNQAGRGLLEQGRAAELLALPFTATVLGQNYGDAYSFTLGPFLLTLPVLFIFTWRRVAQDVRRAVLIGALLLLPIYGYWAFTAAVTGIGMQTRLVIAMLPVSAALGAWALLSLDALGKKPVDLGFVARALIAITLVFAVLDVIDRLVDQRILSVVLGETDRDEFLFQQVATYPATMQRLSELPEGSTVQMLWELRTYYCPPTVTCRPDVLFDAWGKAISRDGTSDTVFSRWQAEGIDYLLFFRPGFEGYPLSRTPELDQQVEAALALLPVVWETDDGRYTLYRLTPE